MTGEILPRKQIIKKLLFSHFSVNKGLIQHAVQSCYNYNLTFRKLEIHAVKMIPISACYTSGRGAPHFFGLGRCTISFRVSVRVRLGLGLELGLGHWVGLGSGLGSGLILGLGLGLGLGLT